MNASSSLPTESTPTTAAATMRCWFGEQHPGTGGPEDWQVKIKTKIIELNCRDEVSELPFTVIEQKEYLGY
jgi:hypothetical protein